MSSFVSDARRTRIDQNGDVRDYTTSKDDTSSWQWRITHFRVVESYMNESKFDLVSPATSSAVAELWSFRIVGVVLMHSLSSTFFYALQIKKVKKHKNKIPMKYKNVVD